MGQKLTVKIHTISGTVPKVYLLNGKYQLILSSALPPVILNQQIVYLTVGVEKGMTYNCTFYVTVEVYRDAESSEYAPYISQEQAFTLPAEHPYLAKIGDVADEIEVDRDGNVSLIARIAKVVLNGSMSFSKRLVTGILPYYETNEPIGTGALAIRYWGGQFDRFETDNPYTQASSACAYSFAVSDGTLFRIRPNKEFPDANAFTEWLNDNPVTCFYIDTMPTRYRLGKITPLTVPESTSSVWTDAELTPNTTIEYTKDINIVVARIEDAIASIG